MKFNKTQNFHYPSYELVDGKKLLRIMFAPNGDLYWVMQDLSYSSDEKIKSCSFVIDKENYKLFESFLILFERVTTSNVFENENSDEIKAYYQDSHDKLVNGNTITWYSDETNEKVANYVKIINTGEEIILEFHTQEHIEGYDTDDGMFYSIPIRFRNSGSRYTPFNIIFVDHYQTLENIDDVLDEGHQIHMEEYYYELTRKRKKNERL